MVGWTRRNSESARRRALWYASLTEEERAEYHRQSYESDRRFERWAGRLFLGICLLGFLCWRMSH